MGNVLNEWRKPEFSSNYFNKSIKVDEIAVESVCQHRKERLWLFIVAKYIHHDILISAPRCIVTLCYIKLLVFVRPTGRLNERQLLKHWASLWWFGFQPLPCRLSCGCVFCFCFCGASIYLSYHLINPLNPKSDQHLISPFSITPESHIKVIRVKEIITRKGTFQ